MNGIKGTAKRLCCWLLTGILLTGQGSLFAYAEEVYSNQRDGTADTLSVGSQFDEAGLHWEVIDAVGRSSVSCEGPATGTTVSGKLEIPLEVTHEGYTYCVSRIAQGAFAGCTELTEVEVIGNGSFRLGRQVDGAGTFEGCTGLKKVTLPVSCESIENRAFKDCTSLQEIDLSGCQFLDTLYRDTFKDCTSLEKVLLPDAVEEILTGAFEGCSSLEGIILPAKLRIIGSRAFKDCAKLKSIKIPVTATLLKGWAFEGCSSLQEVEMPDKIVIIGIAYNEENIFNGCTMLKSLKIDTTAQGGASYVPPRVRDNKSFDAHNTLPAGHKVVFLNSDGTAALSGSELMAAKAAYRAAGDGDTTDDYWYGWELSQADIYPIGITVKKDGAVWADSGKSFQLSANGTDFIPYVSGNTNVPGGIYRIYEVNGSQRVDTKIDVTVDEDNVVGEAEINYYTLEISAGTGGTVTPGSDVNVKHGEEQTVIITPARDHHIKEIFIDGAAVTDADLAEKDSYTYTFSGVNKGHKIEVTFEADSAVTEPEEPNKPGTPDTPEEPNGPGTPDAPKEPDTLGSTVTPEEPNKPATPDTPDSNGSGTPQTPDSSAPGTSGVAVPPAAGGGNTGSGSVSGQNRETKTGDNAPIEMYATLAMIAGLTEVMLYFAKNKKGMTEDKKKELVESLINWAKRGSVLRRYAALIAIFGLLLYYHSIGKYMSVEREAILGA